MFRLKMTFLKKKYQRLYMICLLRKRLVLIHTIWMSFLKIFKDTWMVLLIYLKGKINLL